MNKIQFRALFITKNHEEKRIDFDSLFFYNPPLKNDLRVKIAEQHNASWQCIQLMAFNHVSKRWDFYNDERAFDYVEK